MTESELATCKRSLQAAEAALAAANAQVEKLTAALERQKCFECGSEMTACAQCNPELPTRAALTTPAQEVKE